MTQPNTDWPTGLVTLWLSIDDDPIRAYVDSEHSDFDVVSVTFRNAEGYLISFDMSAMEAIRYGGGVMLAGVTAYKAGVLEVEKTLSSVGNAGQENT